MINKKKRPKIEYTCVVCGLKGKSRDPNKRACFKCKKRTAPGIGQMILF
jgi:hypothetical protein